MHLDEPTVNTIVRHNPRPDIVTVLFNLKLKRSCIAMAESSLSSGSDFRINTHIVCES